jgi:hypothetical protein
MEPDLRLLTGPVYVIAFGALARWGLRSRGSPFLGGLLAGLGLMPLYFAPVAFATALAQMFDASLPGSLAEALFFATYALGLLTLVVGLAIPGARLPRAAGLTLGLLLGYGLGAIALVVTGFERFDLR